MNRKRNVFTAYVVYAVILAGALATLFVSEQKEAASALFGVFAGGVVTWILGVQEERRKAAEELDNVALGIHAEILFILRGAVINRFVWAERGRDPNRHVDLKTLRKFDPPRPPFYEGTCDKLVGLPARMLGEITRFYNAVDIIRRDVTGLDTEGAQTKVRADYSKNFSDRWDRVCRAAVAAVASIQAEFPLQEDERKSLLEAYGWDEPVTIEVAALDTGYQPKIESF